MDQYLRNLHTLSDYELRPYLELNQARLKEMLERLEDETDIHNLKVALELNKIHNNKIRSGK